MTMIHHDSRDYKAAVSEAAKMMRDKLHARIEAGKGQGQKAIEKILREVPDDQIVADKAMAFDYNEEDGGLLMYVGKDSRRLHSFALGQIAENAGIPKPYLNRLMGLRDEGTDGEETVSTDYWGTALAAHNLNEILQHRGDRHLHRSVGDQLRGFLSTKYRRLNHGQMLDAFTGACRRVGALPYEAYAGDTKFMVKAVIDRVIEPIKDEVICLGVVLEESPYGDGATGVLPFIERCFCTNKAVMTSTFRQVHLGGRLQDDIEWSEETYAADTKATCLAIDDLVKGQLGEATIDRISTAIVKANEQKLSSSEIEKFLKKSLSKDEAEKVTGHFASADIENLPKGQTAWRLSNALSFFAKEVQNPERAYEIQKVAGHVMDKIVG